MPGEIRNENLGMLAPTGDKKQRRGTVLQRVYSP